MPQRSKNAYVIKAHTGIRVFHDYMHEDVLKETNMEELMKLEYDYCRQETYRNRGRYVHILAEKI